MPEHAREEAYQGPNLGSKTRPYKFHHVYENKRFRFTGSRRTDLVLSKLGPGRFVSTIFVNKEKHKSSVVNGNRRTCFWQVLPQLQCHDSQVEWQGATWGISAALCTHG